MPVLPGYNAPDPEARTSGRVARRQPTPTEVTSVSEGADKFNISEAMALFMRALQVENDYTYGIPQSRWDALATGAGVGGANYADKNAQGYVVAYWLNQYYQQFHNWNLVAVAWENGAGTAKAIAFQVRKEPSEVTAADIERFNPEVFASISGLVTKIAKLTQKGWQKGIESGRPPPQPTTVITGTARVQQEDRYLSTVNELQEMAKLEEKKNQPTPSEMLFRQLETLSGVVTGGEGRVDWRSDFTEVESGGSVQQMEPLKRPGE